MSGRLLHRRALVTGAGGFIGSRLARLTASEGAIVTALLRSRTPRRLSKAPGVTIARGDLNKIRLERLVEGCDYVFNAAYDPEAPVEENLAAFDRLVDAAKRAEVKGFIHFSSVAVYDGWPRKRLTETSPRSGRGDEYKSAKYMMEERLAEAGLPYVTLQPTCVYGPGGWRWTDRLIEELKSGTIILPRTRKGRCHAVYLDDLVEAAILAALKTPVDGARYIVSGPARSTWGAYLDGLADLINVHGPKFERMAVIPSAQAVDEEPHSSAFSRRVARAARAIVGTTTLKNMRAALNAIRAKGEAPVFRADGSLREVYRGRGRVSIKRAKAELGYDPKIDIARGVRRIAQAYRL